MCCLLMTTPKLPDSLFDLSLTPHNARAKGYEYIDDVIYEVESPDETMLDILTFLREFHGKLGVSRGGMSGDSFFGLYLPKTEET